MKALLVGFAFAGITIPAVSAQMTPGGMPAGQPVSVPRTPKTIKLDDGYYSGMDAGAQSRVKADGALHAIAGDPNSDEEAVTVVNDHRIKVMKRFHGGNSYLAMYDVSPDNRTLTYQSMDMTNPAGRPLQTMATYSRVGAVVPGMNAVSGQWRPVKIDATVLKAPGQG